MKGDFDAEEYRSFITISVASGDGGTDREVSISHAAFRLHVYAAVMAVAEGRPGFVSDRYLDEIAVDATRAMDELVHAGLWERDGDGYAVRDSGTLEFAEVATRWADDVEANCVDGLGHIEDPAAPGRCARCHGPMPKPGDGEVFGSPG